jgi:hypothetical protein
MTRYYSCHKVFKAIKEMASSTTKNIDWDDVIKKEARGSGDEDLGEVQEVGQDYVLVQRGMINKKILHS